LVPLLLGHAEEVHREKPLYWFFYRLNPSLAVRDGRWVLIADTNDADRPKSHALVRDDIPKIRSSRPAKFLLFDLENDLAQRKDVAAENFDVYERLKSQAIKMHRDVIALGYQWDIPADYGKDSKRRVWDSY
jgi:hypothetical protein